MLGPLWRQTTLLLTDAADFNRLSGRVNASFIFNTRGATQKALVGCLNGIGGVRFANGAIEDINLDSMVRNVKTAFMDSRTKKAQKTGFSRVGRQVQHPQWHRDQ